MGDPQNPSNSYFSDSRGAPPCPVLDLFQFRGLLFGAFSEFSEEARKLLCYAADATAARTWVEDGATSQDHTTALLKNRLYRRWGIKTAREYARIKIDGLRLVGGNPDFTNAPGHGDDDARFYDRQQAYVHARGG